jgi:hypothetical protein
VSRRSVETKWLLLSGSRDVCYSLGHIKLQYIGHSIPIESPKSVTLACCVDRHCSILHIPISGSVFVQFLTAFANMPPVGPRAPKEDFMRALNLNSSDPHHEGYYRAMRVGFLAPDIGYSWLTVTRMRRLLYTPGCRRIEAVYSNPNDTTQTFSRHFSGITSIPTVVPQPSPKPGSRLDQVQCRDGCLTRARPVASTVPTG